MGPVPLAEAFWVACSVVLVIVLARRPSMKRLAFLVIVLMFLDSFVDLCAMGHESWWAGPPVLVEWKWDALRANGVIYRYLYAYWAVTWGMQVPLRCFAMAWVLCDGSWKRFTFIAAGLNLIWLTAPQDFLFYFVWLGLYDAAHPYFNYLPPEGTWNLWNMLLLRVPIGVGAGSLLVWGGMHHSLIAGNPRAASASKRRRRKAPSKTPSYLDVVLEALVRHWMVHVSLLDRELPVTSRLFRAVRKWTGLGVRQNQPMPDRRQRYLVVRAPVCAGR